MSVESRKLETGDNRLDVILLAQVGEIAASREDGNDAASAGGNLRLIIILCIKSD